MGSQRVRQYWATEVELGALHSPHGPLGTHSFPRRSWCPNLYLDISSAEGQIHDPLGPAFSGHWGNRPEHSHTAHQRVPPIPGPKGNPLWPFPLKILGELMGVSPQGPSSIWNQMTFHCMCLPFTVHLDPNIMERIWSFKSHCSLLTKSIIYPQIETGGKGAGHNSERMT